LYLKCDNILIGIAHLKKIAYKPEVSKQAKLESFKTKNGETFILKKNWLFCVSETNLSVSSNSKDDTF